jgi:hypothetical protein
MEKWHWFRHRLQRNHSSWTHLNAMFPFHVTLPSPNNSPCQAVTSANLCTHTNSKEGPNKELWSRWVTGAPSPERTWPERGADHKPARIVAILSSPRNCWFRGWYHVSFYFTSKVLCDWGQCPVRSTSSLLNAKC